MSHLLYRIDRICAMHDLPKLNDLVVNKDNKPGYKQHEPRSEILAERRRVFEFDWYALVPRHPRSIEKRYLKQSKLSIFAYR